MKQSRVRELWRQDTPVTNAWLTLADPWVAELIARQGFNILTVDAQHGHAKDFRQILSVFQAISGTETVPFVRVPWNDPAFLMSVLDAGALGVICPMINSRQEAEAFVQACRYPPQGCRSFGPLRAERIYENYFREANEQIITMAMIETADGFKNIEEIAKTETLDGLFLGPWDLSISMGHRKVADFESDEMKAVFKKVLNTCARYSLKAGIHCSNATEARLFSEMGFRLVTVFNDTSSLEKAAKGSLDQFKRGQS